MTFIPSDLPPKPSLTSSNTTALGRRGGGAAYDAQIALERQRAKAARQALLNARAPVQSLPAAPVARPLGAGFPGVDSLDGECSDRLLPPAKIYTFQQAKSELEKWKGRNITDVKAAGDFLMALNAVNASNTYLIKLDRLDILKAVTEDPLLSRLKDVMRWPAVLHAQGKKNALSFQGGYMALISFLTSDVVLLSTSAQYTLPLYALVHDNIPRIIEICNTNIARCVHSKTFSGTRDPAVEITTGLQIFWPMCILLQEIIARYPASQHHAQIAAFVLKLAKHFDTWAQGVSQRNFTDALTDRLEEERKYFFGKVRRKLDGLGQRPAVNLAVQEQGHESDSDFSDQEEATAQPPVPGKTITGVVLNWNQSYSGPGELRNSGPRHDNDHAKFRNISIPPTMSEILSPAEPFLPASAYGAKHHIPTSMIDRLLDSQFRLTREDAFTVFIAGVREARRAMTYGSTHMDELLANGGGMFRAKPSGEDAVEMPLMANLRFSSLGFDKNYGLTVGVIGDAPPGAARSTSQRVRANYFEESQRMASGSLVALVSKERGRQAVVHLAILTTYIDKIMYLTRGPRSPHPQLDFSLHFLDGTAGFHAAQRISPRREDDTKRIMLECGTMYEAVRPFLECLKAMDPGRVPMSRYLIGDKQETMIDAPEYTKKPGFRWDLGFLLKPDAQVGGVKCIMNPNDRLDVKDARKKLKQEGKLDPSQADAVIDCLTRELSLIQGPPGTGKTFTGVELLRLLVANNVGPILLLAFTNHALDHILRAVHDNGVTDSILRMGSRSKDEVVANFLLKTVERSRRPKATSNQKLKTLEDRIEELSKQLSADWPTDTQVLTYLARRYPTFPNRLSQSPRHVVGMYAHQQKLARDEYRRAGTYTNDISLWTFWLRGMDLDWLDRLEKEAREKQRSEAADDVVVKAEPVDIEYDEMAETLDRFGGLDIADDEQVKGEPGMEQKPIPSTEDASFDFMFAQPGFGSAPRRLVTPSIQTSPSSRTDSPKDKSRQSIPGQTGTGPSDPKEPMTEEKALQDKQAFLQWFGYRLLPQPQIVSTRDDLDLAGLLQEGNLWSLGREERQGIAGYVASEAKFELEEDSLRPLGKLVQQYDEARKEHETVRHDNLVELLRGTKILGATTAGAARLPTVLKGFAPKVLVIEEAGQVLEAHVLATLFPSVEHVIALGDPLQLRPQITEHRLSVNSGSGRELYRYDVSMMERLSENGFPMSQLAVQRRMRPTISSLIRNTLYPKLQDHERTQEYPEASGVTKNVFFLDHRFAESSGSGQDRTSKYNAYEVEMACDLAMHFLKQGCYNDEGDVVILCAYAGQLRQVQRALAGKVMIMTDERDHVALNGMLGQEGDSGVAVKHVEVSQQVSLRTIDNFQGEEAKIVIVSLVRNEGEDAGSGKIGFLATNNRVNVALSRAKHGMFILGNATQLSAQSDMWRTITEELAAQGSVGGGWPIGCARHGKMAWATQPGDIEAFAPEGGCHEACATEMPCGHICSRKCHPDDIEHRRMQCESPCPKTLDCGHRCEKMCWEDCGDCETMISDVKLPCGHIAEVPCWQLSVLSTFKCRTLVQHGHNECEHTSLIPCCESDEVGPCTEPCAVHMQCCGKACPAPCHECQEVTTASGAMTMRNGFIKTEGAVSRTRHVTHACDKTFELCGHACGKSCGIGHECGVCMTRCKTECGHGICRKGCGEICDACEKVCTWACDHQQCSMPCSMPCDRLPCNEPCPLTLRCGHPCPSVCGELCRQQICTTCSTEEEDEMIVDPVSGFNLQDAMEADLSIISLACGHTFTVPYLDSLVEMNQVYTFDRDQGIWAELRIPSFPVKRPVCPSCSTPFWSPRYGRLIKAFNNDRQDQKAGWVLRRAISISGSLVGAERAWSLDEVRKAIGSLPPWRDDAMPSLEQLNSILRLSASDTGIIDPLVYKDIAGVFKIDGPVKIVWERYAEALVGAYRNTAKEVNAENRFLPLWDKVYRMLSIANEPSGDAMTKIGITRPDAHLVDRLQAVIHSIRLRIRLVALARDFEGLTRQSPSAIGSTRSETKLYVEVARTMARRFGILAWTLLRSCRRDIDFALNQLHTLIATREKQGVDEDKVEHLWLLRARLECLALFSHMEWARQVHLTRVVELSEGKGLEEVRTQAIAQLVDERLRGIHRWEMPFWSGTAGRMKRRDPRMYRKVDGAVEGIKGAWQACTEGLKKGEISLEMDWAVLGDVEKAVV